MKTTSAMLCAALAAALTFSTAVEAKRLKISHVRPQGTTIDNELKDFAKAVEKATDGDIKLRIFAASALGDYTTVQERISVGAVDMAVQPAATGTTRKMQISSFPYLAEDWASARKIYGPGGAVREAMAKLYAGEGITMLAAYPVYFGGISLNRAAVSAGDPSAKKGTDAR
jgi:TRAP-type C4-dicarboxylate transport system substrate-binding protein